jgi:hypothetical protein
MSTSLIQTEILGRVSNDVFNAIHKMGVKIPNPILREVSMGVAEQAASIITSDVSTITNRALSILPFNSIGINNPVDLISSNLGPTQLFNNLTGTVDNILLKEMNGRVISLLEDKLMQKFPRNHPILRTFREVINPLTLELNGTIEDVLDVALHNVTESLFGFSIRIPVMVQGVKSFWNTDKKTALKRIDDEYTKAVSGIYIQRASEFDINNDENKEKLITLEKGFVDPTGTYPTKEYKDSSETNKLAKGDVRGTIVLDKNKNRLVGAKLPNNNSWDQPESSYKAQYPYNKVTHTESGHIIEIDDTPGAERLHVYHKSGTFIEIDANGSIIKRCKGTSYEIIDKNNKVSINGSTDVSINGSCNIFVGNNANIEVDGDTNITCHNDITMQAGGKLNFSAKEEINISSEKINIQAYNDMNMNVGNDLKVQSTKDINLKSGNDINTQAQKTINVKSGDEVNTQSKRLNNKASDDIRNEGSNIHNKASKDLFNHAGNDIHTKADDTIRTKASNSNNNPKTANGSKDAKDAGFADISKIGVLDGRKDIQDVNIDDPSSINMVDTFSLRMEEDSFNDEDFNNFENSLLTSGITTYEKLREAPIVQDSDPNIKSYNDVFAKGNKELKNFTKLPGNYVLTPNFTLEMLSNKAAVTKDNIKSTNEISYGEIVFNLQQISINILEPIINLYPNMIVTSGYRDRERSTKTSHHPLGKAVDIQIKGLQKKDYFDVAKRLAEVLNFDQFILEYTNYSNNPWIHISFNGENNRRQILTFWNNKKHSNGLSKLA